MQKFDYKKIEELYTTLSSIENSGDDVLTDIKKEINNEELILLKDDIMPYLAKHIADSLKQLRCQMDISFQYDGAGNLNYSFCKSGSRSLIRGIISSESLLVEENMSKVYYNQNENCKIINDYSKGEYVNKEFLNIEYYDKEDYCDTDKSRCVSNIAKCHTQDDYLYEILKHLPTMRTMKVNGKKSPHKAIFIMTIIKGIMTGHICDKIYLDKYLISTYENIWNKYVPKNSSFRMDLANPFIHLSSEPFYNIHFIKTVENLNIGWTISRVKQICDYAYIDERFVEIIKVKKYRDEIITSLMSLFELRSKNNNQDNNLHSIVPKLPKPKILNKYCSSIFKLVYPNGIVIESYVYLDVFVDFVKYANPVSVRELNIFSLGCNIVSKLDEINHRYIKGYKDVGNGLYLNTICTTQRKYEIMSYISQQLKLNVIVELKSRY